MEKDQRGQGWSVVLWRRSKGDRAGLSCYGTELSLLVHSGLSGS